MTHTLHPERCVGAQEPPSVYRDPRRSFFDPPTRCCLTVSTLVTDHQFAGPTPRASSSFGTTDIPTTIPESQKEATLAAHPVQTGPDGVDEMMLGVAMEAPHRLVLVSLVLETHQRPAPLRRLARRFSASSAILAGPVA